MARNLDVYLHNVKAGVLEQHDDASLTFAYNKTYLEQDGATAISVSMPLQSTTCSSAVVKPYFSGLLPDDSARQRLGAALGISDTNAFGMLEIIGGECGCTCSFSTRCRACRCQCK